MVIASDIFAAWVLAGGPAWLCTALILYFFVVLILSCR